MDNQNPEPPTWADVGEIVRTKSFGRSLLFSALWMGALALSLRQLRAPDLSVATRLLWCGAPLPFLGLTLWGVLQKAARQTEMERRVTERAASITFALTIGFYITLGLVNLAFPISAEDLAWSWMWPVLTYFALSQWLYRRYNPR